MPLFSGVIGDTQHNLVTKINILMLSHEFLVERVVNLITPKQREKYAQEVWDMLSRSYKNIGGFKGAANLEELVNTPGYWKLVKRGPDITAINIYKKSEKTHNYKGIASATETVYSEEENRYKATERGLKDYNMIKNDDVKLHRSWTEVSGKAEKFMARSEAKPVPNQYAGLLTGKQILELNDDGYHYTRLIHGEPYEKIIYGFVDLSVQAQRELIDHGFNLKHLPDNIVAKL